MRTRLLLRLAGAALPALLAVSACSSDCPNCPGGVVTVQVSPSNVAVLPGHVVQVAALVFDAKGHLLSGHPVTWSSGNTGTAMIDATGHVTGVAAGNVTISADVEGKTGAGTVRVVTSSTLSGEVYPVLRSSCALSGCHVSPGPPPNLSSLSAAYASLVTSGAYLTPGDTTTGLLLQRLKSTAQPMPPGTPFAQLQPGNYDLIALWIEEGAQNN
jgi:hypothetical protein